MVVKHFGFDELESKVNFGAITIHFLKSRQQSECRFRTRLTSGEDANNRI